MLRTNYELSEDANNYYLQNVECHCEISSRSPKFAKRAIMNLTDVSKRCFCPQQKVPACDLTHVTFQSGVSVPSKKCPLVIWLTAVSQRFQKARVRTFRLPHHFIVVSQWDENPAFTVHAYRAEMKLTQCCYQGRAEGQ